MQGTTESRSGETIGLFPDSLKLQNNIFYRRNIMKATEITEELELQIIEHYKNNTARSTAKYFHIRPDRLNKILAKYGIERHVVIKTALTDKQIAEILTKYKNRSDLEICREYHITKDRLHQILQSNSVQLHTIYENQSLAQSTKIDKETELKIIEFYTNNNMIATCREFSTNSDRISKILAAHNIPLHTAEEISAIKSEKQSLGLQSQINPEVKEFLSKYSKEEFIEWYYTKPNCEILEHFNISMDLFNKLRCKFELQNRSKKLIYHKTPEVCEAISIRQKIRFADKNNHPMFGKHLSEESKKKLSRAKTGKCYFRQTPESLAKSKDTKIANAGSLEASYANGIEAAKKTCLERYGVENVMQLPEIAEKMVITKHRNNVYEQAAEKMTTTKQAIAKAAGFDTYNDLLVAKRCEEAQITEEEYYQQWRGHITEVMRQNGTFNTSRLEDTVEQCLVELGADFVHGYSDPQKYPFLCDFYLPQSELFLEIHGTFTHGGRPFDKKDPACLEQLEKWQSRMDEHPYYKSAIYTWTDLDVRKVKIAEENNLNFKALYLPSNKKYSFYKQTITDLLVEQNLLTGRGKTY